VALAVGLVVGVLAQVVIGGIVVLTGLNPWSNVAHYLVSVVLITGAWALWRRTSGDAAGGAAGASDAGAVSSWRWVVVALGAAAIVAGTIVTGSGPHAGDERAVRIGVQIRDASRVHGAIVWAFLASVAWLVWRARRSPAVRRAASVLIGVGAAQTAIGYAQYALGLPIGLVAVHVAGSIAVWVATLSLWRASGGFGARAPRVVD
jgi:cytochrome c oxidase assembly protein subunit 15